MELLQVAENAKKARGKLDWLQFTEGWSNVKEQIYVAPLDHDCLRRSLFTHSEENEHLVTGLWPEVLDRKRPPEHTVRRLIFRPSEETIWDEQDYQKNIDWITSGTYWSSIYQNRQNQP